MSSHVSDKQGGHWANSQTGAMLKSGEYVYALIKSGKLPEDPLAKKKALFFESIKLTDSDKKVHCEYLKKVLSWAQKEYYFNVMIDSSEYYINRVIYRKKNNRMEIS